MYPIEDFENVENQYWEDFYPDDLVKQWIEILTNTEIANLTTYSNPNRDEKPYHKEKTIFYGTHLFFWQNFYGGETDVFVKPIDNEKHIELFMAYYSDNLVPKSYFYANIDTIYKDRIELCGALGDHEHDREDNIPKGNMTKDQAYDLLTEWELTIK